MKFKKQHQVLSVLGCVLLFVTSSCSRKRQPSNLPKNNDDHAEAANQSLGQSPEVREATNISKSLGKFTPNADVIEVVFNESRTFDHPELHKQATMGELAAALKGESPLSLREELHDPNSRWNEDPALKGVVVGRLALLTGLIGGASESYPRIPELFLRQSHPNEPTLEDVLTLRIVDLASTISEQKVAVSSREFKAWKDLAASPNVCYRKIALLLFDSLRLTSEQAEQFFSKFLQESDTNIAEKFIAKVAKSADLVDSRSILVNFKNDAPAAKSVMTYLEVEIDRVGLK
jgi:hypothetical protein